MQEIEVKILEVDKIRIIQKLEQLGAVKKFDGEINAFYFDFPDQRLTADNKLLRVRTKGEEYVELTFKKKISKEKAKIMEEHEVTFKGKIAALKEILSGIGLEELRQIQKHRISYSLGNIHFELDKMPNIPLFLEIEATSLEELKEAVEKLDFTMDDAKPWSAKDVLNHYKNYG